MNSEYLSQLTDDQNNSCDSDYEFVSRNSSRENSDCELEGYRKIKSKSISNVCASSASSSSSSVRRLSKHFDINHDEKLKLCLSPEKISLLTNSPKRISSPRELYIESQEQKANNKSRTVATTTAAAAVPSFTIVPINLGSGKEDRQVKNESQVNLPEIVLTSFEVAKNSSASRSNSFRAKTNKIATCSSSVFSNGCIPKFIRGSTAVNPKTAIVYQHQQGDQSSSPESTQISGDSSLSNRSSENSNTMEKQPNSVLEIATLMQQPHQDQSKSNNIDYGLQPSTATAAGAVVAASTEVAVKNDPIPEDLQCGICHEAYKDPRTLFCLHSFCFQCLVDENFKQDSSIPFWSQPNQKDYDWKSSTKSSYSIKSISVESSPEMSYRNGSAGSTRPESRSSFTSFRSKKSAEKNKNKVNKKADVPSQTQIERSRIIICKECQQSTEVPIGGIRQLPQNFVLVRKIEAFKLKIGNDVISKIWCSLCYVETSATFHCITCTINLCTFCKESHERQRHTASHRIKNILELRKSRNLKKAFLNDPNFSIKCSMHPGFEMKAFCSSCRQVACSDCLVLLHKGHKHESITKAFASYSKAIKESTDQARPLCDYAHHSISRLNEIARSINKKCDTTQADVDTFMAAYTEAIELHGKTLIQQIARARESKVQMIVEQQLDMEKRSTEAMSAIRFSEDLFESGNEVEILSFVNILLGRFEFCQKFKTPIDPRISDTLHFLPEVRAPVSKSSRNIPIFGIITTQTVEPSLCTLETEGYSQLRVHRKVEMVILSRDADGMPLCHGGLKIGVQLKYKELSSKYLPVEVNDRRDGSYGINFVPIAQGTMVLTITINDKNIKGSPFTFAARTVRPHTGIYHCCTFCSSKGSKQVTCSCDGRMPGYNGCGHGHNGHPGRRHWSCCGNILENSECTAANKLLNP
ncbi:tripartite motif-containing protein 45 [Eupeodes corollae]|uniref:tripartite motif-containing protein 45 n=1 Tax=Eupeodes corollae TaxID=290404 RepID=UPI002490E97B|nr:tripartite motif-containing protein 45 [Eupeodes corollae]